MKMDVILFGETMPSSTLQDAMQAAALADVLLVIGTSLKVGILVGMFKRGCTEIPNLV
jgi:NAD-dependent SIR2 family protein deacetylase